MLAVSGATRLSCSAARCATQWSAYRLARQLSSGTSVPQRCLQPPKVAHRRHCPTASSGLSSYAGPLRGLFHIPVLGWGAAKLGAAVSGAITKKHMAAATAKWLTEQWSSGKTLQSLRRLNDQLLASGAQGKEAHAGMSASLLSLESQLLSVADSKRMKVLREWLTEAERQAPELAVAIAHAYADSFKGVKAAKAFARGLEKQRPNTVAGQLPAEWEQRIHAAFPELRNHSVVLVPNVEPKEPPSSAS